MKVKCPNCKEHFNLNMNQYEEGDSMECPECSEQLMVIVKNGKLAVETENAKYYEEELEYAEEYE